MAKKPKPWTADAEKLSAEEIRPYLTDQQARFVREYRKDRNATQAAIRAGYTAGKNNASAAVRGSSLLDRPQIIAYLHAIERAEYRRLGVGKESITLQLTEIFERCMQATPVMQWDGQKKEWVESGVWQFNASGAVKALTQLIKLAGLDKVQMDLNAGEGLEAFLKKFSGEREF